MSLPDNFNPYGLPTPEGDWAYRLDDHGISYSRNPLWPFRRRIDAARTARFEEDASVRMAPDTGYRAWNSQYVTLLGPRESTERSSGYLKLFVRKQGMGTIAIPCTFDIDLRGFECTPRGIVPPEAQADADLKFPRITAFLQAEAARRDAGRRRPVTAYEIYMRKRPA